MAYAKHALHNKTKSLDSGNRGDHCARHAVAHILSFILNGEILAEEIVRTLVSSIGLILAMPFTTAVAVLIRTHSQTPSDS